MIKKFLPIVFVLCLSSVLFAQRGVMVTMNAGRLYTFCKTFQTAFSYDNGSDTYKDRKELVESTRAFNYVEAVMDESNGAHWDVGKIGEVGPPKVREFHWIISTKDMINVFVKWMEEHPENGLDPANVAIKEAGIAADVYVYEK